jgi:hypothetical protein
LVTEAVSGRGVVFASTVNFYQFHPDVPPPNVIAIVELVEQADLRVPTNVVRWGTEVPPIGLAVQVLFEQHGEVFVPVFEPVPGTS